MMPTDPIVREIYEVRERLWEECHGSVRELAELQRRLQAQQPDRLIDPQGRKQRLNARRQQIVRRSLTMVRHAIIESRRAELEQLCREHHVRRLDVFGSATTDEFDPQHSDLDLIVEFDENVVRGGFQGDYFTLLDKLQQLFGRSVDLIEPDAIRNPYFRRAVEQSRQPIYEA